MWLSFNVIVRAFPLLICWIGRVTVLRQSADALNGTGDSLCYNFFTGKFIKEAISDMYSFTKESHLLIFRANVKPKNAKR